VRLALHLNEDPLVLPRNTHRGAKLGSQKNVKTSKETKSSLFERSTGRNVVSLSEQIPRFPPVILKFHGHIAINVLRENSEDDHI
jgi:hypothetical protein